MKLRFYIPVLVLVFLGVNANQQQAHAELPPIFWSEFSRVIDGFEVNYRDPYLWIRSSLIITPTDPVKTRLCYKVDLRQKPYATQGWVSIFNYALNSWTQAYGTLTDSEKAWCWQ